MILILPCLLSRGLDSNLLTNRHVLNTGLGPGHVKIWQKTGTGLDFQTILRCTQNQYTSQRENQGLCPENQEVYIHNKL